jgi:hypothetical protein
MKFMFNGERAWDGECTVLRARRLLAGAKQEGFFFHTSDLDRASAKLHSLFGERLHEVFEEEVHYDDYHDDYQWPSMIHSCDDDPAAANATAGDTSGGGDYRPRYNRVYFVPIVRTKMATDGAGGRSKKTYVSLDAIGPGAFKVKEGLKACKFKWDGDAWHYNRDTDDKAPRKSFGQIARDLRAQFAIHRDGIPVRLKPASDEADYMHERMCEIPVQETEVKEEVIDFGVKEEEAPVERRAGTNDRHQIRKEWHQMSYLEKKSVCKRLGQMLKTADLEKTTIKKIQKELERHTGVDFSKHKTVIRDMVEKWLKIFNENKKVARDNRKRAAPAASHAETKMSEARSRPRVKREPGAEATSVKREQSPEPSVATAQFAAGAPSPITPGRRRSS